MANYTAIRSKSATLVAATEDTVVLTCNTGLIEVMNRSATDPISFTCGPNVAATDARYPAAAVSLGDNVLVVPPNQSRIVRWPGFAGPGALVRIIGPAAVTPAYTVQGVDPISA